jgi:hypothetical protein
LIKLHGSIGDTDSLVYTLEQYDVLESRNTGILQRLSNRPLLIAGYSGYDTDVLPALFAAVDQIPLTVIVKHPGSSPTQPVFGLVRANSRVVALEAGCHDVFSALADGYIIPDDHRGSTTADQTTIYREASEATGLHKCPFMLMAAFSLAGSWREVHRYAWLTHDAYCDAITSSAINPEEYRSIHLHIAYTLKLSGDDSGSRIMLAEAKNSLNTTGGRPSESMKFFWMEAMIRDAPNQQRTRENGRHVSTGQEPPFTPSIILAGLNSLHSTFAGSKGEDSHDEFIRAWQLGIVRRRENNAAGAIEAFDAVVHMISKGIPTHLERGRFLLDFGGALYQWAIENESLEFREKANAVCQMSASCTERVGDWVTNAQAHLMLAKIYISAGFVDRSQASIAVAHVSVAKTNDAALRSRIEEFINALVKLRKSLPDH